MGSRFHIQMMDNFALYIDERHVEYLASKTRKGAALIEYLVLNHGQPVPNYRILATLWADDRSANPESALKTLVRFPLSWAAAAWQTAARITGRRCRA